MQHAGEMAFVQRSQANNLMFNIVLFEPEIPPNTGNIIRLAANTGCRLHLIEPLGFELDDKRLRRAGLDYSEFASVQTCTDWNTFVSSHQSAHLYALTTRASRLYSDTNFKENDYFIFGPETRGLPAEVRDQIAADNQLRIPMLEKSRSLNLANAVALVIYEAWRQHGFSGGL